ncbi:endogenous retrovirus group K member 6 Pol protein [Elysia marginata]|uniref:Endogenous retrovirus group K member 6 Pol protein n=1 Tax=Elysia marginata TaxID=1093978 RepID=A0AAV4JY28_9GAST|nr:endogenous retrovirus group K member 6 Pol protein [Elysia marginata]
MSKITASDTIFHLRSVFTTHGLPDTIVSDNGPTFTSQEFQDFMKYNNIHHIRAAPYHPSSNGLAERAVETYKSSLRKMTRGTVHEKANRFLFKLDRPIADQVQDKQTPLSEPFHIVQSPLAFEQDRQVPQNQQDRDGTFSSGGGGEETEGLKQRDSTEEPEQLRRSTRTRKAPQKLNL